MGQVVKYWGGLTHFWFRKTVGKTRKSKHTGIVLAELIEGSRCCCQKTENTVRRETDLDWTASTNALSWFVLVNFSAKSVELNTHDAASQK